MSLLALADPIMIGALIVAAAAAAVLSVVIIRQVRRAIRSGAGPRLGFGLAVVIAAAVAVIGGITSFDAVAHRFNSPLIPLVADGMVIACTALRLAAMTRGWRIPGALITTYVFIIGSVVINMASVEGWAAKLGHALAPLAYAVLVEMLAYLLRLQMRLARPPKARLSALTWFTSPVVTTRVWLHLARTGADDPIETRALVQQVVRMASRLASVCPSKPGWLPIGAARGARSAALQCIRDGLLTARDLAGLLPTDRHLTPGELLALVDRAALGLPTSPITSDRPAPAEGRRPQLTHSAQRAADSPGSDQGTARSQQDDPPKAITAVPDRQMSGPTQAIRGEKKRVARAHWDSKISRGEAPPDPKELAAVSDADISGARKWHKEWLPELADQAA